MTFDPHTFRRRDLLHFTLPDDPLRQSRRRFSPHPSARNGGGTQNKGTERPPSSEQTSSKRSKDSGAFDMEKNPPLPSLFALCGNHTGRMKKRLLHPERFEAGSRLEWPMSRDSPPVSSCIRHSVSIDTGSFSPPTLSSDTE
ncbi:hypothetical protein TNIN_449591 [Trichonephila inaurata madagascariensis]|uniref:Uncharacterized protein n=1 Tax=Trichonephila inaurata madagascariensis TaxID=2747483 RepID=A0A8X6J3N6_9ARAC|nr:hypothetical protein TNIN_449591 [Trichonephila inaurata madagascariensis]